MRSMEILLRQQGLALLEVLDALLLLVGVDGERTRIGLDVGAVPGDFVEFSRLSDDALEVLLVAAAGQLHGTFVRAEPDGFLQL